MFNKVPMLIKCLKEHDEARLQLDIMLTEGGYTAEPREVLEATCIHNKTVLLLDAMDTIRQLVYYIEYLENKVSLCIWTDN